MYKVVKQGKIDHLRLMTFISDEVISVYEKLLHLMFRISGWVQTRHKDNA